MLPTLRDEYAQVMKELEQEQADIAEIEGSDKEYLNELKVTIAEQEYVLYFSNLSISNPVDFFSSTELEAFRADVSEAKAKLDRLEEKLAETEAQKEEANNAISQAQHVIHVQKESTSAEVFRLRGEVLMLLTGVFL